MKNDARVQVCRDRFKGNFVEAYRHDIDQMIEAVNAAGGQDRARTLLRNDLALQAGCGDIAVVTKKN